MFLGGTHAIRSNLLPQSRQKGFPLLSLPQYNLIKIVFKNLKTSNHNTSVNFR
jgi:hypothetical protein